MLDSEVVKMLESSFFVSGHCTDATFSNSKADDWKIIEKNVDSGYRDNKAKLLFNTKTGIMFDRGGTQYVFSGNTGRIEKNHSGYRLVPSENISGICEEEKNLDLCNYVYVEDDNTRFSKDSAIVPEYQHEGLYLWNSPAIVEITTKHTFKRGSLVSLEAIYFDKTRMDRYHEIPDYFEKENMFFLSDTLVNVVENGKTEEMFVGDIENPENYIVKDKVYYSTFEYVKLGTFFTCSDEMTAKFFDYYKSAEDIFVDGIKTYTLESGEEVEAIHDSFHDVYITNTMEVFKKCCSCQKLMAAEKVRVVSLSNKTHKQICNTCFENKFGKLYGTNEYIFLDKEDMAIIHGDENTCLKMITDPYDKRKYLYGVTDKDRDFDSINCFRELKCSTDVYYLYDRETDEDGVEVLGIAQHKYKTKKEAYHHLFKTDDLVKVSFKENSGGFGTYFVEKSNFEPYKELFENHHGVYYTTLGKVRVSTKDI